MKQWDRIKKILIIRHVRHYIEKRLPSGFFDTTSIGDISFLLFIFFIVTSSFMLREGIFLSLPSARASSVQLSPTQVMEVIPENEGFKVEQMILSRSEFAEKLRRFKGGGGDRVLIIRMPLHVKYERLVDTLSVAREVGMRRVSLQHEGGKN
ncbi:MAG: biopolymer transporter ExbD [Spirochaetes bacterium]|nr:biopolymer transporter ExbD [Spirochaetota bacterium]